MNRFYSDQTQEKINALTDVCIKNTYIDPTLYTQYDVKRGLRDLNGHGVLTGLTDISRMDAYETVNGSSVPCDGKLFYRGYSINDLVGACIREQDINKYDLLPLCNSPRVGVCGYSGSRHFPEELVPDTEWAPDTVSVR